MQHLLSDLPISGNRQGLVHIMYYRTEELRLDIINPRRACAERVTVVVFILVVVLVEITSHIVSQPSMEDKGTVKGCNS